MISILDIRAYALQSFFNLAGRLGSPALNLGATRDLDVLRDLRYGPEIDQRLDLFRPRSSEPGGLPLLVYFHGGGWISADKKIYEGIAAILSRNGFLTFNVNYRLAPGSRFPAPLQDAACAIDWIHRNATKFGGDRSTMVLAGDSAGAQIAAWYASALHKDSLFAEASIPGAIPKVGAKGLLLFYGVYDFETVVDTRFPFIRTYARSFLGADRKAYALNAETASPIRHVSPGLPPVFLCAGERDGLFGQSTAYADALQRCGASCRTLFFSSAHRADHGFLFFRWLQSSKMAFAAAGEFLRGLADRH